METTDESSGRRIVWLDVVVVFALHGRMMLDMGERPEPMRDPGGLEAAVMRPQMRAHDEGTDDVGLAAIFGVGISQAQAFLDGNKRTAYAAMRVFLDLNGFQLATDPIDVAKHLEAIAEAPDRGTATAAFREWLRATVAPRTP